MEVDKGEEASQNKTKTSPSHIKSVVISHGENDGKKTKSLRFDGINVCVEVFVTVTKCYVHKQDYMCVWIIGEN